MSVNLHANIIESDVIFY